MTPNCDAHQMLMKRTRRFGSLAAGVTATVLLAVGCVGITVRSTAGVLSTNSRSWADAARASGSRDIPCGIEGVRVVGEAWSSENPPPLVVVQGCNERVSYMISCDGGNVNCQCHIVARLKSPMMSLDRPPSGAPAGAPR